MDIVVTGPVGTAGAYRYFLEHEDWFRQRFSTYFMNKLYLLKNNLGDIHMDNPAHGAYTEAIENGCVCAENFPEGPAFRAAITEGGVFRSLWEACETLGCGCQIRIRQIPLLQEVVEITELMDESPYEMDSAGSFLVITEDGSRFCEELNSRFEAAGLPAMAAVIGRTTAEEERVIIDRDARRFLVPPKRQKKDNANRKRS